MWIVKVFNMKLSKLFSDIRTYFVLFVIAIFSLGFLYLRIQEGYQIVEVIETKTEPAIELKVTKLQLDRADIAVDDSYKKYYNRVDYNNGDITGDLYYDYYFTDGSSTYERVFYLESSTTICQVSVRPHYVTHLHEVNIGRKMDTLKMSCHLNP